MKLKIIFLALVIGCVFLAFNKYNSTIVENGRMQCQAEMFEKALDHKEWSGAITDEIVSEFMIDKVAKIIVREETRKEAIDEYFKEGITPVINLGPADITDDGDSRVANLAVRMQEYYCSARTSDSRCNPKGAAN